MSVEYGLLTDEMTSSAADDGEKDDKGDKDTAAHTTNDHCSIRRYVCRNYTHAAINTDAARSSTNQLSDCLTSYTLS